MVKDERSCPLRGMEKCPEDECAWWAQRYDRNGQVMGGECAIHGLGYVDYTLQAIANILSKQPEHKKGKRR